MGDTGGKSLESGSKRTYAVITEAIDSLKQTPSWLWDQLEKDGATLNSVLDKIDSLTKAQLQKYFPDSEWGDLASMSKEDRREAIKEKLKEMGVKGRWTGKGPYNPKAGQVDLGKFDPIVDYAQKGRAKVASTLDKMSVDELRQVIKMNHLDVNRMSGKYKTHRQLKHFILTASEVRATKGDTFRYHKG